MKKALICGINGQDGSYLANFLINKNYKVYGTTRKIKKNKFENLKLLGIKDKVHILQMNSYNYKNTLSILKKTNASEIYFLSGQSSVGKSFKFAKNSIVNDTVSVINILEASKNIKLKKKLFFAGSGQCFGDTKNKKANESTAFNPVSPYSIGKTSQYYAVKNYRETFSLFACTGILFNHESPLRPEKFVTKKIITAVHRIANGSKEKLFLGKLDISRDWGWAPDYVKAMWMMLQQKKPEDYIIATGKNYQLKDFVKEAFAYKKLNWRDYVKIDKKYNHIIDIKSNIANPYKINKFLKWKTKIYMKDVIKYMFNAIK